MAWEIENELHQQGWPTGEVIGSEAGLAKTFSVSREVVREAVRIGEVHGSLRMQRGRRGGLVVCRPDLDAVSRSIADYMFCSGVTLAQLQQARSLFEPEIIAQAVKAPGPDVRSDGISFESNLSNAFRLRQQVLERLEEPVLALLWNVFTWLGESLAGPGKGPLQKADGAQGIDDNELCRALDKGDEAAVAAFCQIGESPERQSLASCSLQHTEVFGYPFDAPALQFASRSSLIARRLMKEVRHLDCGERLGSEWELCMELNAGRPVIRQALRLMEDYGLVESRRGRNGGIFVSQRKRGAVLRLAYPYLASNGVQPDTLLPLLWKMNLANVRLAGERAVGFGEVERERHMQVIERKISSMPRSARWIGIQQAIGAIGGNELLDIIQCLLVGYTTRAYPASRIPRPMSDIFLHEAMRVAHLVIRGEPAEAERLQHACQTSITRVWSLSPSKLCFSPYVRPVSTV